MRTTLRTSIAFLASLAVLSVSAIAAGASDPAPIPMPVEDGGGAAGSCLEGTTDCVDTPGIVDGGGMAMCVEGVPDCNDMIVVPDDGGQSEPGYAGDPGEPVVGTPVEPVPVEPTITEPTPGMANVRPRPFDSATVGDDGVTVTIDFVSGVEPCSVLDHIDVDETDDTVTITLFEGNDPTAGDVACIEIGVYKRAVITLDSPLGDRTIVDGAA
jgi:hypothetical protein